MSSNATLFIRSVLRLLLTCAFLTLSASASAASFDCSKARTSVENAICFDGELSGLDETMFAAYQKAIQQAEAPETVRQAQRDWLRLVRNACLTPDCLKDRYVVRIADLRMGNSTRLDFTGGAKSAYVGLDVTPTGISYDAVPPADAVSAKWLKRGDTLQRTYDLAVASAKLPPRFKMTARSCGDANAFYFSSKNTAVLCYELVQKLFEAHMVRVTSDDPKSGQVEARRLSIALEYALLHEIGHGVLTLRGEGYMGREETGADYFASVVLLRNINSEEEITDAMWGVWTMYQFLGQRPTDSADEHESSQQRSSNFACMLVARAPNFGPNLIRASLLTQRRLDGCPREWQQANLALAALNR